MWIWGHGFRFVYDGGRFVFWQQLKILAREWYTEMKNFTIYVSSDPAEREEERDTGGVCV